MPPKIDADARVEELTSEVFCKYCPEDSQVDESGTPYITKDQMKEFIIGIMEACKEMDAWDDEKYDECYNQFDIDQSGLVERSEFTAFVKRFADL